ncbi:unnamed protein product [Mortierella alpina]
MDPVILYQAEFFTGDINTLPDRDAIELVSPGVTRVHNSHSNETAKLFKTANWEVRHLVDPSAFAPKRWP